jgi:uncharacterized protein YdaU (DUF1376 family)
MTDREWKKARPIIQKFFKPGWVHKRVEEELAKAQPNTISGLRPAEPANLLVGRRSKREAMLPICLSKRFA